MGVHVCNGWISVHMKYLKVKTVNDMWYMDSEESGREEVGFGENEDVEMDAWSIKAGHD